ncbi:hypothetical protein BDV96DRAFT_609179 [Lophiotrema nucula]|uniref:Fungal-specific transcription factor domain-containing protein n=1 Tax=Lophiotrema nucula TaxID=690887 RepID=A0A6A5ZT71_9PLEO|nr:hypothetical protein BDV96DRAFT_609179 [Lophiotrema nucula]
MSTATATSMEREYEFFVTTDEPHQPEGSERGKIRRLVMRNFFETKLSGPATTSSKNNSASTVQSKQKLKSRFRLPKPGQEFSEQKAKPKAKTTERRGTKEEGERREKKSRSSRKLSGNSEIPEQCPQSRANSRRNSLEEVEVEGSEVLRSKPRLLLKINPNSHRFDPFDVLPIPGTPQLDMLFKLYKSGSRANSIAINVRNTWWSFISQDAGLLHATLATWALYGMLVRGISDLRVDKLRHKNAAIKEINTKIAGTTTGRISDELVGTVLTLASFENLLGAYDAAQLHIAALKRMVNARGGLFAFGHNDGLIRGMIWVDFHTAAAFHTPPGFPHIRLDPDTPPLPDALLEEAAVSSPTSLLQLSHSGIDCFNIFYRLHRLALAISSPWLRNVDRLTISNLLYETEHTLLSVPDYSRDFLDFDLDTEKEGEEDYEEGARAADGASVVESLLAAAQIFIYAALREVPSKAKIFSIFLERLRVALDRPEVDMLGVWGREKNVNTLLWVLVVATSIVDGLEARKWWITRLAEVTRELEIDDELDLERTLRRVAWTDIFFGDKLDGIWQEVAEHVHASRRAQIYTATSQDQDLSETIDSQLLGPASRHSIGYDRGRWKVNGWYV